MRSKGILLLVFTVLVCIRCSDNTNTTIQDSILKYGYMRIAILGLHAESFEYDGWAMRHRGREYKWRKAIADKRMDEADRMDRDFCNKMYYDLDSLLSTSAKKKFLITANEAMKIRTEGKAKEMLEFKDVFSQFISIKLACCNTMEISNNDFNMLLEISYANLANDLKSSIKHGSFVDARDNHSYKTVTVDDQTWMAENLAYEGCGNNVPSRDMLYKVKGGKWWYKDFNEANKDKGLLYDLWAAGDCNIIPEGWRLPSEQDWRKLEQNLIWMYGYDSVGIVMKSTEGWTNHPDSAGNGTNAFGFNVEPMKKAMNFKTLKEDKGMTDYRTDGKDIISTIVFHTDNEKIGHLRNNRDGYCIRCIKNNDE